MVWGLLTYALGTSSSILAFDPVAGTYYTDWGVYLFHHWLASHAITSATQLQRILNEKLGSTKLSA